MIRKDLEKIHRRTRVLSVEQKQEIMALLDIGWTQKKVADLYGVSQARISQLVKEVKIFESGTE